MGSEQIREKIIEFIHNGILKRDHVEYSQAEIVAGVDDPGFTKLAIIKEIEAMVKDRVLIRLKGRGKKRITEYYTLPELLETYKMKH